MDKTSNIVLDKPKWNPNPTGKGGFQERPEQINREGRWKPENSFAECMRKFKDMTLEELRNWDKTVLENERTVAQDLAFRRIVGATKSLNEFREVADRTEGKPIQRVENKIIDIDAELDKLETDYDKVADQIAGQTVADEPSVQD